MQIYVWYKLKNFTEIGPSELMLQTKLLRSLSLMINFTLKPLAIVGNRTIPPLDNCPPEITPQLIAPSTIPPDNYPHANHPPDNHPLDSYPLCQLPPNNYPPDNYPPDNSPLCQLPPAQFPPTIELQIPLRQTG